METTNQKDDYSQITWPAAPLECHGICQNGDTQSSLIRGYVWSHLDKIKEDGERGCPKCLLLYFSCREFRPTIEWPDPGYYEPTQRRNRLELLYQCDCPGMIQLHDSRDTFRREIQLYVEPGTAVPPWNYIRPAGSLMQMPREEYGSVLSSWIAACNATHKNCTAKNGKLPHRVLCVGSEAQPTLYLHISSGEIGQYVSLSYCWGKSHPPKTTLANLEEQRESVDFDALPRVFQDAVTVTRKIGIRYIWIDSLCIIQDHNSDWQTESSKMAAYYSDASLVIAAAQSENPDQGLFDALGGYSPFIARTATEIGEIVNPDSSIARIYRRMLDGFGIQSRHHSLLSKESPLNTRAWALQENMLARRIVHFTKGELLWECVEGLKCECMEAENDSSFYFRVPSIIRAYQFIQLGYPEDVRSIQGLWLGLLQKYSGLTLSFDSDILPALSGLAKLWQSRGAGTYLAGFWKEYILESILWSVNENEFLSPYQIQRSTKYRAPSWSPFSLEEKSGSKNRKTRLSFGFPTDFERLAERCAVVLEAGSTPAGADPTGQILSAFLRLKGRVLRENVLSEWHKLGAESIRIEFDVDMNFGEGIDLTFLLIGYNKFGGIIALILQPSKQKAIYERVGMAHGFYKEHNLGLIRQFSEGDEETVVII